MLLNSYTPIQNLKSSEEKLVMHIFFRGKKMQIHDVLPIISYLPCHRIGKLITCSQIE